MDTTLDSTRLQLADCLWLAGQDRKPVPPLRDEAARLGMATTPENAYAIQRINRDRRIRAGDRVVGRKIGLTSVAVQKQLGVDSPDFGALWAGTSWADGSEVQISQLIQAKVEAEVALVMRSDVTSPTASVADLIRATDFALAGLEIVDSRIADWKIGLFDTIADNASAAGFVLGADPVKLDRVALREAKMVMTRNGEQVSEGIGKACLGHPLNAAAWLARTLAAMGDPLREGDILLTGALGPMVVAKQGDVFEARIEGLGAVGVRFA